MFLFKARFLAMAELKQAWLCSSGLTKTFLFKARFLPWQSSSKLALLIWLNENALKVAQGHLMFTSRFALVVF